MQELSVIILQVSVKQGSTIYYFNEDFASKARDEVNSLGLKDSV